MNRYGPASNQQGPRMFGPQGNMGPGPQQMNGPWQPGPGPGPGMRPPFNNMMGGPPGMGMMPPQLNMNMMNPRMNMMQPGPNMNNMNCPGPGPNVMNNQGPNMNYPRPNMNNPGPNMNYPGPNMNNPGPNWAGPDMNMMNYPGPNMNNPGPNWAGPGMNIMNNPGPNMNYPGPNMNYPGPSMMTNPGPSMTSTGPSMTSTGPNMTSPGPYMANPGPNMTNPGPNMTNPGPNMTSTGPNMTMMNDSSGPCGPQWTSSWYPPSGPSSQWEPGYQPSGNNSASVPGDGQEGNIQKPPVIYTERKESHSQARPQPPLKTEQQRPTSENEHQRPISISEHQRKDSQRKGSTSPSPWNTGSKGTQEEETSSGEEEKTELIDGGETDYMVGPYCEVCGLHMNSERMLWRHMSGKKHLRALKAIQSGKPLPQKMQDRKEESAGTHNTEETSWFERAFSGMTADEPVIGLGFVVETMGDKEELFTCELCDTACSANNMVLHIIGLKHRMRFLKKCDPERYSRLRKQQKRSKLLEDTRQLCKEVESIKGRGTPRYRGPKLRRTGAGMGQYQRTQLSESEKSLALETLTRTLLQDFVSRNIEPVVAQEMLVHRLELLREYEKRGVPFDLAKEKVIEDEERWSLLLEFERQSLSFEEAEERIDYRIDLLKAYVVNGCPKEEARKKVLDDEVIRDFRKEFQRLGLTREQAQKQVEKRLWMLERLHYQACSQETSSQKVMNIERELKEVLKAKAKEGDKRRKGDSDTARWIDAGDSVEKFIVNSYRELGLTSELIEAHIKLALDSFEKYRKQGLPVDEARVKVLIDKLPIPQPKSEESPADETPDSCNNPGSQADIAERVVLFMSKLHAVIATDETASSNSQTETSTSTNREKQLHAFDQLSGVEMQNLLSGMVKTELQANEAKSRFAALYEQLDYLRQKLFPFTVEEGKVDKGKSKPPADERWNNAVRQFLQYYDQSKNSASKKMRHSCSQDGDSVSNNSPVHRPTGSLGHQGHSHLEGRGGSGSRSFSPDYRQRKAKQRQRSHSSSRRNQQRDRSRSRSRSRSQSRSRSPAVKCHKRSRSPRSRYRQQSERLMKDISEDFRKRNHSPVVQGRKRTKRDAASTRRSKSVSGSPPKQWSRCRQESASKSSKRRDDRANPYH